ncbi:MAG: GntR family transcriptional regulator [Rouxiella badensis]|jgi:DNA-binding GntR family transcriptional regulator|uniref:GntR family transcriptional regulator n=1 Tax=Rouxiella badensis TaxID=1646377 RepID=UPI001787DB62|nr:GntR family transcriptional regulator [Rouxiella badensis]QOI56347.1 GntR family transcriptional regulator [Rouxiella badensis subsp. acadiensis]
MNIDKNSLIPFYLQIEQHLTEKLNANEIKPGDPIPTEAALCEIYGVSRMTARKAVDYLVRQGRVVRFRGRGTFVINPDSKQKTVLPLDRHFTASDIAKELNQTLENRILEFRKMPAGADIAAQLNISAETLVYFMIRLRLLDARPFVYEKGWMLYEPFPCLTREALKHSKYDYLRNKGFQPAGSHKQISAELPANEIRQALELSRDEPILHARSVAYFADATPFEVADIYYNQRYYSFSIRAQS